MRVWDSLLEEGAKILFRISVALLKIFEQELLQLDNPGEIVSLLRRRTHCVHDRDKLMKVLLSLDCFSLEWWKLSFCMLMKVLSPLHLWWVNILIIPIPSIKNVLLIVYPEGQICSIDLQILFSILQTLMQLVPLVCLLVSDHSSYLLDLFPLCRA